MEDVIFYCRELHYQEKSSTTTRVVITMEYILDTLGKGGRAKQKTNFLFANYTHIQKLQHKFLFKGVYRCKVIKTFKSYPGIM